MSVDNRTSNQTSALKRKKMFLAQVEWLPVTSRSHGCMDSVEWNGGMDWTGLDWTGLDWNGLEWNDQMICGRDRPLTL